MLSHLWAIALLTFNPTTETYQVSDELAIEYCTIYNAEMDMLHKLIAEQNRLNNEAEAKQGNNTSNTDYFVLSDEPNQYEEAFLTLEKQLENSKVDNLAQKTAKSQRFDTYILKPSCYGDNHKVEFKLL